MYIYWQTGFVRSVHHQQHHQQHNHHTNNRNNPQPLQGLRQQSHLDWVRNLASRLGHDLLHPDGHVEAVVEVGGLLEEALAGPDGRRWPGHVRHAVPLVGEHSGVTLLLRDDLGVTRATDGMKTAAAAAAVAVAVAGVKRR